MELPLDFLMLIHINVKSLNKKNFNKFHDLVQTLSFTPDPICLSESHIKEQALTNIKISEYRFINACPQGGASGVSKCVQNELKFAKEKSYQLYGCESL